jgi:streptomycin 6-kinase
MDAAVSGHASLPRVPAALTATLVRFFDEPGAAFVKALPATVAELAQRWSLRLAPALAGAKTAFVAPCVRADGTEAVLRVAYPEGVPGGEAAALRAWGGQGAVRLLESAPLHHALLIERCLPGTSLSAAHPPDEVLTIAAGLLTRLWRRGDASGGYTTLASLAEGRAAQAEARRDSRPPGLDRLLVTEAIALWRELPLGAAPVLLHADLHPRNVLAAAREPWLVIDPKPLLGDPAYEPVPLVLEAGGPSDTAASAARSPRQAEEIGRRLRLVSSELGLESARVAAWGVARSVDWALFLMARGDAAGARRAAFEAGAFARAAN